MKRSVYRGGSATNVPPGSWLFAIEAIRAATTTAAELLGWPDKVGLIEAGRYAHIIAVLGNPLANIAELEQVKFVMNGGVVVKNHIAVP